MLTMPYFKMSTNGLQESSLFHGHVFSISLRRMTALLQATVHFSVFLSLSPLPLLFLPISFSVNTL